MIERADLVAAVAEGLLTRDQAAVLLDLARRRRQAVHGVDEEHFRFITSFNDIFVTVAIALLLAATGMLGSLASGLVDPSMSMSKTLGAAVVAGVSWILAEYFTRVRRMAFPSIVLLLAFAGGVFIAVFGFANGLLPSSISADTVTAMLASVATVMAAAVHWRRFHVPITIAAGAAASVGLLAALVASGLQAAGLKSDAVALLMFLTAGLGGLGVFALAMRYDMVDRERVTQRTDIAFWLHLLAAPLIVHPLFVLLGLFGPETLSTGKAAAIILIYLALAVVALAIDRRALLVSALFYVIYAVSALLGQSGEGGNMGIALTCLVIGSFLVMLSAAWHRIRVLVVSRLPAAWAARLPVLT